MELNWYLGFIQAGPNDRSSSISFDLRQLLSRSMAATVRRGDMTCCARARLLPSWSRDASATVANGLKSMCTNSEALGSRMSCFSRAYDSSRQRKQPHNWSLLHFNTSIYRIIINYVTSCMLFKYNFTLRSSRPPHPWAPAMLGQFVKDFKVFSIIQN